MTTATPRQQAGDTRSYRCAYTPLDLNRVPLASDTGVLPTLQVRARNAEEAQRLAFATIGCPIVMVERLDSTPPLPVPDVEDSDFGAFMDAVETLA